MNKIKKGDKVKMSDRNPNHLGNGVHACAGMEGVVFDIDKDGSFILDCGTISLVVPMNDAFKQPKKGVWVWLNGEHIFHKRIDAKIETSPKKWFQWFIPQSLMK
jgi:predicted RNA-binding protein (virulence factor B family)